MCCISCPWTEGDLSRAVAAGQVSQAGDAIHLASPTEKKAALYRAARLGDTEIVGLLLDAGVDLHTDSDAALQWAVRYGHLATSRLLIERGADIRAVHGEALRLAERFGHTEIKALLLERMSHESGSSE